MKASTSAKRPISPSNERARVEPKGEAIVVIDSDEDDLETILARIKESEESEKLARKLQNEWASSSGPEVDDAGSPGVDISDDAALARRLAAEWENEPVEEPETVDVDAWEPAAASGSMIGVKTGRSESRIVENSVTVDVDTWEPSTSGTKPGRSRILSDADDVPPDQQLAEFRSFFIAERSCSKCGKAVKSPRGFVMFSAASTEVGALPPTLSMLLHAPCASCKTNHCRGCFSPIGCPISCKGISKNAKCTVHSCCSGVRALAIFECLGGFDRQFLGERATSESRALVLSQQQKHQGASVGPGGTGYGTDGSRGYYRGRGRGAQKAGSSSRVVELAAHWEKIVVRALTTLASILPSPYADDPQVFDMLPHASIRQLLSLSQLPELLGSLLRNDSVTDWLTRSEIYYAMIALLRRMADCELTVEVLIGQRFCMDKKGHIERAPPLYDYFRKLTKQSEAFLAGAMHMMQDGDEESDNDETIKAMSLCGDIIAARDDMERAISVLGRGKDTSSASLKGKGKNRDPSINLGKAYSEACETLSFQHVELDYSQYNYAPQLKETEFSTRTPKNRLHLVKELATMATSLPPGIFVRVDEVRNDVIKIMIAGPDDTPYSGGLFEFDCFMPLTYPATPPLMHLRTTGGGTVCLSLLGTWPGRPEEQWSSSSTLLQVLVSIQSMILIDAPYYNEPGHGQANPNAQVSINYNREISLQTCRWAMVDWLKDAHKGGLWKDVIASHFTIRKDKIRQKIVEWAAKNPSFRSYHQRAPANRYSDMHGVVAGSNGTSAGGLDLVKEFDSGIARVKRWL
ncbi:hypothetical protein B0H17DRAFT_1099703 [Mycena rosella]|uniref:UBC core domain-containing protein n=1 Tax=Mycena rosella TaxID=1033263 RepID=A0AAD7G0I4_MYCRO|nr:hypothetical protein B0H17DRAFT_1099703 [Mycena rosella]